MSDLSEGSLSVTKNATWREAGNGNVNWRGDTAITTNGLLGPPKP